MSREREHDEPIIPGWNGELNKWPDYCRRVRLCHAQTVRKKRYTLGPRLVLKLSGRAWEVAASLDHSQRTTNSGAQYLLSYLRERLGRLPIPDVRQHLDDLFVRLRRQPGTDMISWCSQVREAYKKVQRSLARTAVGKKTVAVQTVTDGTVGESPRSGSTRRRASGSEPQGEPQDDFQNASAGAEQGEQSPPAQTSAAQSSPSSSGSWNDDSWGQWNDWYGHSWHQWEDEDEEGDEQPWEDEDHMMPVVLPEEVLGWLLMRRSGLSSQAKLAIQAASGNSLKFTDVERAMRLQEEELLHPERARPPHGRHQPRSYWVDTGENWGLYMSPPDELDVHDEDHEIHWLDNESFAAALFPPESVTPQGVWDNQDDGAWYTDGHYDWVWYNDEWYAAVSDQWISYAEMKPWMDIEDVLAVDQSVGKEISELYASFDQKVRTFKEARDLVHQKGKNRGYYPYSPKGKSKGKPKGSSKGKKGFSGNSGSAFVVGHGKGTSNMSPNNPKSSGCFVCGTQGHGYMTCPDRNKSQGSGTQGKFGHANFVDEVYMVSGGDVPTSSTDHAELPQLPAVADMQRLILTAADPSMVGHPERLGYAVLDTGATETVGSLEAIEFISQQRLKHFGPEEIGVDPKRRKRFKFGNAEEKYAESFVLLPQTVNGNKTTLGVYTLDVPGVPILFGVKTMWRLGAVINVRNMTIEFTRIFPGTMIPLVRGQNGHLMLNLCAD